MDDLKGQGRYAAREATAPEDLTRARALRHLCFRGAPGIDADGFDARCRHVLIEDADGRLAATFRVMTVRGAGVADTYSGARYDLSPLAGEPGAMMELGRFCLRPGPPDADLLRASWGALAAMVIEEGASMLFGCTSFPGTDPAPHAEAFALLRARYLAPEPLRPGRGAGEAYVFPDRTPDLRGALRQTPPLLRAYLGMGGWTSDHAVIDRDLATLHVFTALEVARIPTARVVALRALGAR